jgi:hypothetical protein
MDWGIILGVAGIVVTVVIAFLIYHLQKNRMYPGKISASLLDLYRVLGEKPEHYSHLSLKLGDYQVEKNLIYVKLLFFNERSYDVKADGPDTFISVSLPKNAKWVDARVAKQSEAVDAEVKLDNEVFSRCSLNFGLLRKGESILIEGLIEAAEALSRDYLFDKMVFSHRIPNVCKVEKLYCPSRSRKKYASIRLRFFIPVAIVAILISVFGLFNKQAIPLRYIDKETSKDVSLALNRDEEIIAFPRKWSKRDSYIINAEGFTSRMVPSASYHLGLDHYLSIIMTLLLCLTIMLMEWEDITETRRWKRVSKFLLENSEQKPE